jgi:TonB family protein
MTVRARWLAMAVLVAAPSVALAAPAEHRVTRLPKLVHFVEAAYPLAERAAGKTASVVLQIALDAQGRVTDAAVQKSGGADFDAAALQAVRGFVFSPAEIDGKPAPVKITYRYDFVLKTAPKQPVVNFEGVVRDRFTKKPLAGVKVEVEGAGAQVTDAEGRFSFKDVAPGKHRVSLSGPGLTPVSTEETVEKGKKLSAKYAVEAKEQAPPGEESDMEIVVVAPKIKKQVVSTEITAAVGSRVPGTEGDTLKVVENLPGVARAAFGSGQLVVWGSAPEDTRVYVDGVPIPLLYHGGGLRSTINSDLVRAIDLAPGGYGVGHGRGIGGLVTIDTRELKSDGFHGYVAADLIDTSGMIETPIDKSTRVAVAARKSYLASTLGLFTSENVDDFVPIPDFYDAEVKVTHDLAQNESIGLFGVIARDSLTRTLGSADPAEVKTDDSLTSFNRIAVTYKHALANGSAFYVTPWLGLDHTRTVSAFGGTPATLDVQSHVYGFRGEWSGKLARDVVVTTGLDVELSRSSLSRQGSLTLPPREGDLSVFGEPPGDQVNADTWQTTIGSVAPYAQADVGLFDSRLHVVPGLRIEPYVVGASRKTPEQGETPGVGVTSEDTALEPRLAVNYRLSPEVSLKAAVGLYHEAPEPEDLSAVFGNPTLGVEKAVQYLAGASFHLARELTFEETAFYTTSSDLVTRSDSPTPLLAHALVQEGRGRSYGVEFLLRRELAHGFFGWASYTLMRSERQDHPGLPWRLFDYDQTHVFTVLASYDLGRGFEVGARFRYATGYPRTPVIGAFYDARRDLYEPIFGAQNSIRIPAFVQADARVSKTFGLGWGKLETYLDVQNVTNRQNPEEIVYDYRYQNPKYITGLPILPVAGARLSW